MAKVKRRNQVKKMLFFCKTNFGFEPPYKVLIDGTFCKEALVYKVNIREQLPKYLEADARLLTTACAKAECEKYGSTYGKEYTLNVPDTGLLNYFNYLVIYLVRPNQSSF